MKNVENESGKFQVTIQQLQMKNKNLRLKVEDIESQLDEAEVVCNTFFVCSNLFCIYTLNYRVDYVCQFANCCQFCKSKLFLYIISG